MARAVTGKRGSFGASGSAVLLACVGVALALGVVASSAPVPALSFAEPKEYAAVGVPVELVSGDLNRDGKLDVVMGKSKAISVLLNRGDGSFQAPRDYRATGFSLAIGDLNSDGKLDVVAAVALLSGRVSVLLNRGDGTFRSKRDYRTGRGPNSVAIGDLNGDRKPDLATTNTYQPAHSKAYTVSVLLNRGGGRFRAPRDYRTGENPDSIAIGDMNGDRKLDLVNANGENTVSVLLNKGNGSFQARREYRTGPGIFDVGIADLNADGKLDFVTTNVNPSDDRPTVSVLLNRGGGRFRVRREYRTLWISALAIGDLNGDRKPDLVVGDPGGFVSVLLNRGDGRFQAKLDYRVEAKLKYRSAGGESVTIGDLNGDGKVDLATSNGDNDTVSVLINTPGLCNVQDVRRMTLPATARTLGRVNCSVGQVRHDYSAAFKSELVMWQKPAPGAVRPNGDKVDLVVSLGRKPARLLGLTYFPGARIHTALLRNSILNPERGAVEAWYRQESDPVPFEHNPHRIFGGPYSLTGIDEVNLFSQDRLDSGDPRLHFTLFFGDEPPPFTPPHVVAVRSLVDGVEGYPISDLNGRWIHIAGVWDRLGIRGSSDTVRLYVDGEVVAASQGSDWGITPCASRRPAGQWRCFTDIAGCNDTCEDTFAVDNLKLWNYAKTDYSDRVEEGSSAEPGLLLWNKLGSADEVSHSAYGPNLVSFDCFDPETPHFGQRCTIDVPGKLAYPRGVFGGAAGITNSLGLCRAPKVRGKTLPAARRAIAHANCRLGKVRRAYSKTVKRGRVISQKPKPGTVLPNGVKVDLVVSLGRKR